MSKRALLIGHNYFGQSGQLSGCIQDIQDMEKYLTALGYQTVVLCDSQDDPEHKAPNCSTRANIMCAIHELVSNTRAGDMVYIHYSGHGSYDADNMMVERMSINGSHDTNTDPNVVSASVAPMRTGRLTESGEGKGKEIVSGTSDDQSTSSGIMDEPDGRDECICPVDYALAGMIYDDELYAEIVAKWPEGASLRAVFDCCHSGSGMDLPWRWDKASKWSRENARDVSADILMISGCRDNQTSADASIEGKYNGALTWSVLKALKAARAARRRGEARSVTIAPPTWEALVKDIRTRLMGYSQVPQFSCCKKEQLKARVDLV